MAGLRFTELQSRPMEFLDFTSLTLDEFQQLVPPFEAAFHARMAAWRMDGKPRTARRFTVYKNHIPPNLVVECVPTHRKPPEVRICRLSIQSAVGTRPPSTSTPHCPACLARC